MQKIPLTQTILDNHRIDLFYFLTACWVCGKNLHYNFDDYSQTYSFNLTLDKPKLRVKMNVGRSSSPMKYDEIQVSGGEFIALIPDTVYEKWFNWVMTKNVRSRNHYTYLYFYLYFNIMHTKYGWSHSIEQMEKELNMGHGDICKRIAEFETDKLIERSPYQFNAGGFSLSRTYWIPDELKTEEKKYEDARLEELEHNHIIVN